MTAVSQRVSGVGVVLCVCVALAGCSKPKSAETTTTTTAGTATTAAAAPVDTAKEADAIRAMESSWSAEMAKKDPARFADHYTTDAVSYVHGMPLMQGKQAMHDGIAEAFKDPNFTLTFTPAMVVVASSGDVAWSRGAYSGTRTDPKTHAVITEKGAYLTTYTKGPDGRWLAVSDFSGDLPQTGGTAATTAPEKK